MTNMPENDGHMTDFDRFGRITASVVAAILRSPGCTQSRKWAWRCITGREPHREGGWDIQRGLEHEEDAITVVEVQLATLAMPGRFIPHRSIPWLGSSPDGFIKEPVSDVEYYIPVEAKCPRICHVECPPMYYAQVQTQIECCDVPYAYFVSWTDKCQKVIKVERDTAWWDSNFPELERFYNEFVLTDIEPPKSPRRGSKGGSKKNHDSLKESIGIAEARLDHPVHVVKRGRGRPKKVKDVEPEE